MSVIINNFKGSSESNFIKENYGAGIAKIRPPMPVCKFGKTFIIFIFIYKYMYVRENLFSYIILCENTGSDKFYFSKNIWKYGFFISTIIKNIFFVQLFLILKISAVQQLEGNSENLVNKKCCKFLQKNNYVFYHNAKFVHVFVMWPTGWCLELHVALAWKRVWHACYRIQNN